MFNIWKGWPYDGAISDNGEPLADEGIVAGMAITKDATGKLIKALGTELKVYWAIENQSDPSVQAAGSLAYIVSNAIILTDQYDVTADYTTSKALMVDKTGGKEGQLIVWDLDPGNPIVGYHDGFVDRDDITFLKVEI